MNEQVTPIITGPRNGEQAKSIIMIPPSLPRHSIPFSERHHMAHIAEGAGCGMHQVKETMCTPSARR